MGGPAKPPATEPKYKESAMRDAVAPAFGLEAFNCPISGCGTFAHQRWFSVGGRMIQAHVVKTQHDKDLEESTVYSTDPGAAAEQFLQSLTFSSQSGFAGARLPNAFLSQCSRCGRCALWIGGHLSFPRSVSFEPHHDMPETIRSDYLEAAQIAQLSPKGAAALLRLCVQRLVDGLVEGSGNLNTKIAKMVASGLDRRIQQALDIVRVTGNEAVHPGQIAFDEPEVAFKLFGLVNFIVETQISQPRAVNHLFEDLPPNSREQISRRDRPREG